MRTGPPALAAVVLVVTGVVVFADVLGIDHQTPFVQMIAFRPQIAVVLVVLAALVLLVARRLWAVAVALAVVGVLGLVVVAPRMTGEAAASSGRPLDVLTVNTYLSEADPAALATTIRDRRPGVVALPEADRGLRDEVMRRLGPGYRSFVADERSDVSPMAMIVDRALGSPSVTVDRATEFPSIVLGFPDGLRVVAAHPQSPKPGNTWAWRRDVAALARWCAPGPPTVVAGDLNATFDHAELRSATTGCTDAASSVGQGLTGTWPAALPRVLGSQIDHVLLARGPSATGTEVVDVPGSDHRGLLVHLRR